MQKRNDMRKFLRWFTVLVTAISFVVTLIVVGSLIELTDLYDTSSSIWFVRVLYGGFMFIGVFDFLFMLFVLVRRLVLGIRLEIWEKINRLFDF